MIRKEMSIEFYAFRYLKDNLDKIKDSSDQEDKILSVLAYGIAIGGDISEYNLLMLLAYAGFDMSDPGNYNTLQELTNFYCGTGVLRIINNDLGHINNFCNEKTESYQLGKSGEHSHLRKAVDELKMKFSEDFLEKQLLDSNEEVKEITKNMNEKRTIGNSPCPNCNKLVPITDINKFEVHYPKGLTNPFAIVECENCGTKYTVNITWVNAYLFDRVGCKAFPFSFARGEKIEEQDIDTFMANFEKNIEDFLENIKKESS
jgi:hypothetical protein